MLDLILEVYGTVIAEHRAAGGQAREERTATARFLRHVTSLVRTVDAALTDHAMPLTRAGGVDLCRASLGGLAASVQPQGPQTTLPSPAMPRRSA